MKLLMHRKFRNRCFWSNLGRRMVALGPSKRWVCWRAASTRCRCLWKMRGWDVFFSLYEPRFGHHHPGSWRDELYPPPALHPAVLWGGQGDNGGREDRSGLGVGCRDKKRHLEFKFAIVSIHRWQRKLKNWKKKQWYGGPSGKTITKHFCKWLKRWGGFPRGGCD